LTLGESLNFLGLDHSTQEEIPRCFALLWQFWKLVCCSKESRSCRRPYYTTEVQLDDQLRAGLLAAISGFAKEAFKDSIESFSLSKYEIVCTGKTVKVPGYQKEATVLAFAIIDKGTKNPNREEELERVLDTFLNRYSILEVTSGNISQFEPFKKRMDDIFDDLRLKSEDRFKSIF